MMRRFMILNSFKLFNKLCRMLNRDFGCRDAFGCNLSCPLWIAREVEWLMNEKGMTLGEAYRATVRKKILEKEKQAIMREIVAPKKDYPINGKEEILGRQDNGRIKGIVNRGPEGQPGVCNNAGDKAKEDGNGIRHDSDRGAVKKGS